MVLKNPYAHSLDGLEIEDPVQSFFDYCKKREAVRVKRESGEEYPWSDDPILQKGRFLNVFREDDKVSKSIIKSKMGAYSCLIIWIGSNPNKYWRIFLVYRIQ